MDLEDIQQYSHKIKKIHIKNDNKNSQYQHITIKISIDDKKDNEIIRFSANENSDWLTHQSFDNDYFLEVPNNTGKTTTIYAHYFPSSLYDYLEDTQVFSVYDWSELLEETPISQYHNESYYINDGEVFIDDNRHLINGNILVIDNNGTETRYTITNNGITVGNNTYHIRNNKLIINGQTYRKNVVSNKYDYRLDDNDKLIIRSQLEGSINGFKDPNYKNYTKLIDDNTVSNESEKGYFPLSSRYRGYKYLHAPDIKENPLPYWSNSNKSNRDCTRSQDAPYWETKIHRDGLSPLISEDTPINVYLNYQYLPTSTEYHQHYYGFEPKNPTTNDMYEQTPAKTYTVLDSENLTKINHAFAKPATEDNEDGDSTYRIINYGNPFDSRYTVNISHDKVIPIDLSSGQGINVNCEWDKNKCEGAEYWIYTPHGKGYVPIPLDVEEGEPYKLQYYMYIPSDSVVEYDSCTVEVEHQDMFNTITKVDKVSKNEKEREIWLKQDKILRDQWIYHELDFIAEENSRIIIKGPQHQKDDRNIETEKNIITRKSDYQLINDDKVFFTHFRLIKMGEYSPTLKYADTGLYLVEQDQYTFKNSSEHTDVCVPTPSVNNKDILPWKLDENTLPIPIKDVYIIFDDDFDIIYNDITSELSWTSAMNDIFNFSPYDEYGERSDLEWTTNDELISLIYDNNNLTSIVQSKTKHDTRENKSGQLKLYRKQKKVFTTGANNSFTLFLQDSNGNAVQSGKVECAIVTSVADKITPCQETVMCLGEQKPNEYGKVIYNRLNFKKLRPSDNEITYFLRIKYTNSCYDKEIITFKPLIFEREHRNMNVYINECEDTCMNVHDTCEKCRLVASSIYNTSQYKYIQSQNNTNNTISSIDQLPLCIEVDIFNQLGVPIGGEGYCELSINDYVTQSTIVDDNGVADFYIDYNDLYHNEDVNENNNYNDIKSQTIKIEYFTKYDESINFAYFNLAYDNLYDTRAAIPIKLYSIAPDSLISINNAIVYTLDKNEIFILNIDTEGDKDFSISIKVDNNKTYVQDITSTDNEFIFVGEYNNKATSTYTITTKSLTGTENDGPYREVKRTFKVKWI